MIKVEFVRVKSSFVGRRFGNRGSVEEFENVEPIIKERIENGWKFNGYIPVVQRADGVIDEISLIFQKDE